MLERRASLQRVRCQVFPERLERSWRRVGLLDLDVLVLRLLPLETQHAVKVRAADTQQRFRNVLEAF